MRAALLRRLSCRKGPRAGGSRAGCQGLYISASIVPSCIPLSNIRVNTAHVSHDPEANAVVCIMQKGINQRWRSCTCVRRQLQLFRTAARMTLGLFLRHCQGMIESGNRVSRNLWTDCGFAPPYEIRTYPSSLLLIFLHPITCCCVAAPAPSTLHPPHPPRHRHAPVPAPTSTLSQRQLSSQSRITGLDKALRAKLGTAHTRRRNRSRPHLSQTVVLAPTPRSQCRRNAREPTPSPPPRT
jgi:hypothetical protein